MCVCVPSRELAARRRQRLGRVAEHCRKSRIDVLWIFISSRERPGDAVASGGVSLKSDGREKGGKSTLYFYRFDWWNFQEAIIDFTPLVPRAPPLFHSPRLARPSRAVPRIDHQYCPRKITISSSARSSIGHGRHMPPRILRIRQPRGKIEVVAPYFSTCARLA